MISCNVLFDAKGLAYSSDEISSQINEFNESYKDTIAEIIKGSRVLDADGKVFVKCATRILKNFKMTRRGAFQENLDENLYDCWSTIGASLIEINTSICNGGLSRDRFLLEVDATDREYIINQVWDMTKAILPFTMTKLSYGLVGASKILFSILPEIALPVDNTQWKLLFKTVDLGDVIRFMVSDIQKWESTTGQQLNLLDRSRRLTTLPAVYNVMAMMARP